MLSINLWALDIILNPNIGGSIVQQMLLLVFKNDFFSIIPPTH